MHLQFLGAATTVTGSQFLLTTERAKVLIDCGMFQGSPNESIRNRIPLAYEPSELDAILLTHAHLDHCGLIPHVVKEGFHGPIWATRGTVELAGLVLLDSGKLQQEFAKRGMRWEKRNPERAAAEDQRDLANYEAAIALAEKGEADSEVEEGVGSIASGDHVPTTVEPMDPSPASSPRLRRATGRRPTSSVGSRWTRGATPTIWPSPLRRRTHDPQEGGGAADPVIAPSTFASFAALPAESAAVGSGFVIAPDPETALRAQPAKLDIDLDEPLYDERDARASLDHFRGIDYDQEIEVAPGIHATFVDAGHILGSAIIRLRVAITKAALSGGSSSRATSAGPTRPSSATRRSSPTPTTS